MFVPTCAITIYEDRVEYRLQLTQERGEGGVLSHSTHPGDRTVQFALGEVVWLSLAKGVTSVRVLSRTLEGFHPIL